MARWNGQYLVVKYWKKSLVLGLVAKLVTNCLCILYNNRDCFIGDIKQNTGTHIETGLLHVYMQETKRNVQVDDTQAVRVVIYLCLLYVINILSVNYVLSEFCPCEDMRRSSTVVWESNPLWWSVDLLVCYVCILIVKVLYRSLQMISTPVRLLNLFWILQASKCYIHSMHYPRFSWRN